MRKVGEVASMNQETQNKLDTHFEMFKNAVDSALHEHIGITLNLKITTKNGEVTASQMTVDLPGVRLDL